MENNESVFFIAVAVVITAISGAFAYTSAAEVPIKVKSIGN